MNNIIVIGAGGHAKVVIESLRAAGRQVDYCVATEGADCVGVKVLHGNGQLKKLRKKGYVQAIVAIGSNIIRAEMAAWVLDAGYELITVISPHAVVSPSARLGKGTVVLTRAVVNADAVIGDQAIINTGAVVEHDCRIGSGAHLAPLSGIGGNVTIGNRAFLGLGASVIPGVKIGSNTIVGAGAVVIADLAANVVAVGVPARIIKKVGEKHA
jgi:UDP-perosamine 4-acetyltransferase